MYRLLILKMWVLNSIFLIISVDFASAKIMNPDAGLPNEPGTKIIKLSKINKGSSVQLNFRLKLPSTQSLNKGAPSFVAVYEKTTNGSWIETKKINLNKAALFLGTNEIEFSENINLNNEASEVAVYSTIYHCGSDHKTPCYIQGFKGKTLRTFKQVNSGRKLDFHIAGWMN